MHGGHGMTVDKKSRAWAPGTLWSRTLKVSERALRCGALQSIPTDFRILEEGGIRFVVRILTHLTAKERVTKEQGKKETLDGVSFNPFLPYEEDLFVCGISDTHLCLLNKFNVVDHHLLMVTRVFEEQDAPLGVADFEAICLCLSEIDGLVFYNGGEIAGASQRHKHLQLVPLPLAPGIPGIPIEAVLKDGGPEDVVETVPALRFAHAYVRLAAKPAASPRERARILRAHYEAMRYAMGRHANPPLPYNLLITRRWMLLVPRSREKFASISRR